HIVDGEIELLKKVRGSKKAINTLVSYFKKRSYDIKNQFIGIAHADDMEKANYLKDKIKEMGGKVFCIEQISSGVGAHIGIGGLGLFFLNRDD
ncbi:MAG TPA: DegV family protein, partial [Halanaerobiales bacterium]|nr:DegV family protein [Halanaerobiales bacterium]